MHDKLSSKLIMEGMISIKMNAAKGGVGATVKDKVVDYSNYGRHEEEELQEEEEEEKECTGKALKEGEKIESAKAEMTEVREENARLKMLLDKIEKDYKSLQMRFTDVFQSQTKTKNKTVDDQEPIEEPDQLVFLSLGRTGSREVPKKESSSSGITISKGKEEEDEHLKEGLKLGLNYDYCCVVPKPEAIEEEYVSPEENSSAEAKEETWPPSKVKDTKTMRPSGDDDDLSQASVKRARVSVRARCDTTTMNDGCQWRKYGQKIAKGNPCPRAYYRCTVAPSCPVRKQVQRCADDMSILITTYEGTHNHPLPISATAMASTTSAAASMLLSGSSSSQSGPGSSNLTSTFHSLNVSKTRSLYLPNSSSSPPFPTITLDLTTTTPTTHLNMFSTSFHSTPRFPSPSLSFSPSQTNFIPALWGNGNFNYGITLPSSYSKAGIVSLQPAARPPSQEPNLQNKYQTYPQQALTETLTKAITSDPSFRTVIAAALSTVVGGAGSSDPAQANKKTESLGKHLKISSSNPLTTNGKGV